MSNYVKQAIAFFKQGDYKNAKHYYTLASNTYGNKLFNVNIALCDKYIKNAPLSTLQKTDVIAETTDIDKETLAAQLATTQAKLEYYYTRCQELQYQIMDAKNA